MKDVIWLWNFTMTCLPREGYLKVGFQIISFLNIKHNGVIVFDPYDPDVYLTQFPTEDWLVTPYAPYKDDVPSNATAPRRMVFTMGALVKSDQARESVTRF